MSAVTYPITIVMRARALREADWSLRRIVNFIEEETGHRPSLNTVAVWVDETQAERHVTRNRARHRRDSAAADGCLGSPRHSREYQEARAVALIVKGGMRQTQVALAMDFDYPEQGWTEHRVRHLATRMGVEPNPNMVRAGLERATA